MRTILYFAAPCIAFAILYVFVAILLCCELNDYRPHWWCPACLLFGKRRLP